MPERPLARCARFAIGALLAGSLVGCQAGQAKPGLQVQTGTASAAAGAISIETGDWTYAVPLDGVTWVDQAGLIHQSGRPDCLADGVTRQIRFAAVEATVEGTTWRPVVWVSCQ